MNSSLWGFPTSQQLYKVENVSRLLLNAKRTAGEGRSKMKSAVNNWKPTENYGKLWENHGSYQETRENHSSYQET